MNLDSDESRWLSSGLGRVTVTHQAAQTWMSHGGRFGPDLNDESLQEHALPDSSSSVVLKGPGQTSLIWANILGPPLCAEPNAGYLTTSPSCGMCPNEISQPVSYKLCLCIAQVHREALGG